MPATILLTNDDGWDAPGLAALALAAGALGKCLIVAPAGAVSGCGHGVTTRAPIQVARPTESTFAVSGTPADCVRLALDHLLPEPKWVISGINAGGNLGCDIHYSGTVAAVREAALYGVPGIAISQYLARERPLDWPRAARWTREILEKLMAVDWQPGTFWNVNLPHLLAEAPEPEIVACSPDPAPLPLNYEVAPGRAVYAGNYQSRARTPGSDVDVCFGGRIAVTLVRVAPCSSPAPF
jgi:5'-nucleotidase